MPYLPPFLLFVVEEGRYRSYVTNRDRFPHVSLDTWREVYEGALDEFEQRYQREHSGEEKIAPLPAVTVNDVDERRYRSYVSNCDGFAHVSPDTWRQVYGDDVDALEDRYLREVFLPRAERERAQAARRREEFERENVEAAQRKAVRQLARREARSAEREHRRAAGQERARGRQRLVDFYQGLPQVERLQKLARQPDSLFRLPERWAVLSAEQFASLSEDREAVQLLVQKLVPTIRGPWRDLRRRLRQIDEDE